MDIGLSFGIRLLERVGYGANAGGQIDIKLLADGLYTAMTTTVAGLIVGIIAYIAYNHLVVRTNKVIHKMEANSVEFLDHLNEPI